ncbi:MAG: MBOAT family protein [Casimicrobiaceae bacterium]
MVFASPIFLFLFLPLVLAAYFALPRRFGNAALLVASLVFYSWGEGAMVVLVLGSVAFNWVMGAKIGDTVDLSARRRALALAVGGNLALLAIFKYTNFFAANLNVVLEGLEWGTLALAAIPLPLGISFFTFHSISYLVDIYRRNASAQRSVGNYALYIMLFPQLIAGPIIRYRDIAAQITQRQRHCADVGEGVRRFIIGLGKKVLIANTLGAVADRIFGIAPHALNTPAAWLGVVCYTLQIYFDFSGYSDMAIGLMRIFGFRILENFNYPYISQSVREFWRRWHISLSNFFRDYLYIPLGGNRRGTLRAYANLIVVFLLCGLWHGANWTFIVWGAWHGVFLVLEHAGLGGALERAWRPLRHVYALLAVTGGWVLFRCDTLGHAGAYYAALVGNGPASASLHPLAMYLDPLVATTLVAAVIGSMPIGRALAGATQHLSVTQRGVAQAAALGEYAWLALVLLASFAYLASGTYNPFIYFRF